MLPEVSVESQLVIIGLVILLGFLSSRTEVAKKFYRNWINDDFDSRHKDHPWCFTCNGDASDCFTNPDRCAALRKQIKL
jgi:hypothetical protein